MYNEQKLLSNFTWAGRRENLEIAVTVECAPVCRRKRALHLIDRLHRPHQDGSELTPAKREASDIGALEGTLQRWIGYLQTCVFS